MARHGIVKPQPQPYQGKSSSGGLSHNSITVETLARIPDLVHAPRTHRVEVQNLYKRACLDAEELVERQAVIMKKLATGESPPPTPAAIAMERIVPLCQTAHSVLLCVSLGCNAILLAFSPWDIGLIEESTRYCDDVISLAKEVTPYRPLGASHFPLCLIAAYLTVTEPTKREELQDLLMDFQTDFAGAAWLNIAVKARDSYWAARTAHTNDSARQADLEAEDTFQRHDRSFCAVQ
jgi:hypothetical protein